MTSGQPIELHVPIALAPEAAYESMIRVLRSMSDDLKGNDRLSLTLFLRDLHVGVIGEVAIPVDIAIHDDAQRWECSIELHAVSNEGVFPTFNGKLSISPTKSRCELRLAGDYRAPLGPVGTIIDRTVLRHAARRSLESFLSRMAMEIMDDARSREREHERDVRRMHS